MNDFLIQYVTDEIPQLHIFLIIEENGQNTLRGLIRGDSTGTLSTSYVIFRSFPLFYRQFVSEMVFVSYTFTFPFS